MDTPEYFLAHGMLMNKGLSNTVARRILISNDFIRYWDRRAFPNRLWATVNFIQANDNRKRNFMEDVFPELQIIYKAEDPEITETAIQEGSGRVRKIRNENKYGVYVGGKLHSVHDTRAKAKRCC